MQSEDRIIHFSCELIHKPAPIKKETLQRLYFDLSQTKAAYDSTDFTVPIQPRFYSRRGQRTQSVCLFLPDRVVLIEEWADIPLSSFLERVRIVAENVLKTRGIESYAAHTATIRSTFALTYFDDARVFLLDHVCAQQDMIEPHFRRPLSVGGLRFVLPETPEHPGRLHIVVESFQHSKNEVYVEVKGVYASAPVDASEVYLIAGHIDEVRSFISDSIFPYLNQYDAPRDAMDA